MQLSEHTNLSVTPFLQRSILPQLIDKLISKENTLYDLAARYRTNDRSIDRFNRRTSGLVIRADFPTRAKSYFSNCSKKELLRSRVQSRVERQLLPATLSYGQTANRSFDPSFVDRLYCWGQRIMSFGGWSVT